jgi:hypothetical protein
MVFSSRYGMNVVYRSAFFGVAMGVSDVEDGLRLFRKSETSFDFSVSAMVNVQSFTVENKRGRQIKKQINSVRTSLVQCFFRSIFRTVFANKRTSMQTMEKGSQITRRATSKAYQFSW